jgi:non-specific serine/threonine protein kinase
VFAGGWTLEAAESVCASEAIPATEILDRLTRLVEKSLVLYETEPDAERYRMLETVRQYGRERLAETGTSGAIRARHAACFGALTAAAETELHSPQQAVWLARLEAEHDNLRAALDWFAEGDEGESGLRMAGGLLRFWEVRGHYSEGRARLQALLSRAEHAAPTALRAKALGAAGSMAKGQGDLSAARSLHAESLALLEALGDAAGVASALNNLGNMARLQGEYESARALCLRSLELSRQSGNRKVTASALGNLGELADNLGETENARAWKEESLALYRELGDTGSIALLLNNLGNAAYRDQDFGAARRLYEESLALQRALGSRWGTAMSLLNLGLVLGIQSEYAAAHALLAESLSLLRQLGDKFSIAYALEAMAELASAEGRMERAARLIGAAESLRAVIGSPVHHSEHPEQDRVVTATRAALGAEAYAALLEEGRGMTLEQAVSQALEEAD